MTKILGHVIHAHFCHGVTFDWAMAKVACYFSNIQILCVNCYAIDRAFQEARRGFMIGKGRRPFVDLDTGKVLGRQMVTMLDDILEKEGRVDEIRFEYKSVGVYATISKTRLNLSVDRRDEWTQDLICFLEHCSCFEKVDVRQRMWNGEITPYYANLLQRLEEGDFEGGE